MSAYGNPRPYASADLEREAMQGRLKVARSIERALTRDGDARRAARWSRIADELLDHLAEIDARATTAAMSAQV